jgi:hypothetical protein
MGGFALGLRGVTVISVSYPVQNLTSKRSVSGRIA